VIGLRAPFSPRWCAVCCSPGRSMWLLCVSMSVCILCVLLFFVYVCIPWVMCVGVCVCVGLRLRMYVSVHSCLCQMCTHVGRVFRSLRLSRTLVELWPGATLSNVFGFDLDEGYRAAPGFEVALVISQNIVCVELVLSFGRAWCVSVYFCVCVCVCSVGVCVCSVGVCVCASMP
jgi:hypothetical protein